VIPRPRHVNPDMIIHYKSAASFRFSALILVSISRRCYQATCISELFGLFLRG
jgi:hypothetical protein